MDIFIWWIILSILAGWIAGNKGRSSFGIFLLSLVLSPLVGIIVALVLKRVTEPDPNTPHARYARQMPRLR